MLPSVGVAEFVFSTGVAGAVKEATSDGGGESVGGVVWLGLDFKSEMDANHLFHLGLVGGAIAGKSLLDLIWGIFVDGDVFHGSYKKYYTSSFGYSDASSDVLREEETLYRYDIRLGFFKNNNERFVEFLEAARKWSIYHSGDGAIVESACVAATRGLN